MTERDRWVTRHRVRFSFIGRPRPAAGLVGTRREGRYTFHDLNTAPLRQIAERRPAPDTSGAEESSP